MSAYRDAMSKNIKTQILHESYEKKIQKQTTNNKTKNERVCMRGNEGLVQISRK